MRIKKGVKISMLLSAIFLVSAASTLALSSCSTTNSSYQFKVISMSNYKDNSIKDKNYVNIKNVTETVDCSPNDLIYGTNSFNNGKYLLIYGSVGYPNVNLEKAGGGEEGSFQWTPSNTAIDGTSDFYKWLTGSDVPIDNVEKNYFTDFNIQNDFFRWWFNDKTYSPYKDVKIIAYIDIPPVPENANTGDVTPWNSIPPCAPYDVWSSNDILNAYQYVYGPEKAAGLTFNDLPLNWQQLSGTYKRMDESAKTYREFVDYISKYRKDIQGLVGGDNKLSGMIAFNGSNKNPLSIPLDLNDFEINKITGPNLVDAPNGWQTLYNFYFDKSWDERDK